MNDEWLREHLKRPEVRTKLCILFLVGQICAIACLVIGMIMLLLYVLGII